MEQTPDTFPALFWGYTVIWALLVTYIVTLSRRLTNLEKKLNDHKN